MHSTVSGQVSGLVCPIRYDLFTSPSLLSPPRRPWFSLILFLIKAQSPVPSEDDWDPVSLTVGETGSQDSQPYLSENKYSISHRLIPLSSPIPLSISCFIVPLHHLSNPLSIKHSSLAPRSSFIIYLIPSRSNIPPSLLVPPSSLT